jgi:hypothetical protein
VNPANTLYGENTADVKGDGTYWLPLCVQGSVEFNDKFAVPQGLKGAVILQ